MCSVHGKFSMGYVCVNDLKNARTRNKKIVRFKCIAWGLFENGKTETTKKCMGIVG